MIALSMARASAIVAGQVLSNDEMNALVDGLFSAPSPNYTPDGKTVLSLMNDDDIEKLFR